MTIIKLRIPVISIFILLLNACTVGPNYIRPGVPIPAKYKEAPPGWTIAKPQDAIDRGAWWKIFHDPRLNKLEAQVNISNQNIAMAVAQYEQAVWMVAEARAAYFPTFSGSVAYTRQKNSRSSIFSNINPNNNFNVPNSPGPLSALNSTPANLTDNNNNNTNVNLTRPRLPFNTYTLELDASWTPDLWGSVRRTVEASRAGADASAAQLAGVRLIAQATLAEDYFQLRTLDANQIFLNKAVAAYRKSYQLIQKSYAAGTVSLSDVSQALSQLKTAQTQALDNHISRAQFEHAIAVLIGLPPAEFSLPPLPLNLKPPVIPLETPSTLLERRPDIAQAERQVAQANAQIGVAIAAFFPSLDLSAFGGFQSNLLENLFSEPSLFWALGSQLTQLIFDGGLRIAQTREARANYRATVANYRQVVLAAFQNVEDNLVALRILQAEAAVQRQAVRAANTGLRLQVRDFSAGIAAYTAVIVAQNSDYTAREAAISIAGRRMVAAVNLIEAIGGGYNNPHSFDEAGKPLKLPKLLKLPKPQIMMWDTSPR